MATESDGLLPNVSAEAEAGLRATVVDIGYGRTRTMYDLILAWAAHVRRFRTELAADNPLTSPSAWNEHDYVAALFIRDFVEAGLPVLDDDLASIAQHSISQVDEECRSFTKGGYRELLGRVGGVGGADRGWWWDRIPTSGPVVEHLRYNFG